ncbi:MAG: hypothetical protein R3Y60_05290 [bacterium]
MKKILIAFVTLFTFCLSGCDFLTTLTITNPSTITFNEIESTVNNYSVSKTSTTQTCVVELRVKNTGSSTKNISITEGFIQNKNDESSKSVVFELKYGSESLYRYDYCLYTVTATIDIEEAFDDYLITFNLNTYSLKIQLEDRE